MYIQPDSLFLIQALILIGVPFLLWRVGWVQRFAPLVVIQILLGIVLGPTMFGRYFPGSYHELFPAQSLTALSGLASLGLCLLGFLTGLHFDLKIVSKKGYSFLATSFSTLLVPLILGGCLALIFYRHPYTDAGTIKWAYVLGVAIAIGVTALPVLSAILIELKLVDTDLGKRVLGYAAINDISLWILLAGLTTFASTHTTGSAHNAILKTVLEAVGFLVLMYVGARTFCRSLATRGSLTATPSSTQLALVIAGILLSALATQLIGIHFIFGAFVFGAMMPKEVSHGLYSAFEEFTMVALMPFYFMLTGLKISFSFSNRDAWLLFTWATIAAMLGKIVGTAVPERLLRKASLSTALKSGVLMQTKGLMEVVVLNILLSKGIINTTVFSALVLMAVATTFFTKPFMLCIGYILDNLHPKQV